MSTRVTRRGFSVGREIQNCKCKQCLHVAKMQRTILSATRPPGKGITDDMVSMWNETLRNHRCDGHLSLSSIRRTSRSVGPRHDPYHQETWYISRNGHSYVVTLCSLGGNSLEVDGQTIVEHSDSCREIDELVEKHTGITLSLWMKTYDRIQATMPEDPYGRLSDWE